MENRIYIYIYSVQDTRAWRLECWENRVVCPLRATHIHRLVHEVRAQLVFCFVFEGLTATQQTSTIGLDLTKRVVAVNDVLCKLHIWVQTKLNLASFFIYPVRVARVGHCRAGALPDDRARVLPRGTGVASCLRHHQAIVV